MEAPSIDPTLLQQLNEQERGEVLQFLKTESARSKIQTSVTNFTDICFKKCTSKEAIKQSGELTGSEDTCMKECMNSYLDANIAVVKVLQKMHK